MEVWGGNREVDNGVIMPGLDAWVYSRPHAGARSGGDVHYVSSCATGRITRLLLADISGHGAGVGEIGERLRTLMRKYMNYLDQSKFIARLNGAFLEIAESGGFATAVSATYWAPTSVLVACNAGHPTPLWYRAKKRAWQFLQYVKEEDEQPLRNLPLGIVEPTEFEQFGVRLRRDDLVMFYTDSLIEARDAAGTQLGESGLLSIVSDLDPSDPQRLIRMLLEQVQTHRAGVEADDDVTVLLFRHNGTRPSPMLSDRARTIGRMLRNMGRAALGREPLAWPELGMAQWGGAMIDSLNNRWGGPARDT